MRRTAQRDRRISFTKNKKNESIITIMEVSFTEKKVSYFKESIIVSCKLTKVLY